MPISIYYNHQFAVWHAGVNSTKMNLSVFSFCLACSGCPVPPPLPAVSIQMILINLGGGWFGLVCLKCFSSAPNRPKGGREGEREREEGKKEKERRRRSAVEIVIDVVVVASLSLSLLWKHTFPSIWSHNCNFGATTKPPALTKEVQALPLSVTPDRVSDNPASVTVFLP